MNLLNQISYHAYLDVSNMYYHKLIDTLIAMARQPEQGLFDALRIGNICLQYVLV